MAVAVGGIVVAVGVGVSVGVRVSVGVNVLVGVFDGGIAVTTGTSVKWRTGVAVSVRLGCSVGTSAVNTPRPSRIITPMIDSTDTTQAATKKIRAGRESGECFKRIPTIERIGNAILTRNVTLATYDESDVEI